jgi:DNA-binding transcriptional regulator YdaS (Cro superfamily)
MTSGPPGIQRAVEVAGNQRALATILGVTQQAVSAWVRRGYAPADRVVEIEAQTGVARETLVHPRLRDLLGE